MKSHYQLLDYVGTSNDRLTTPTSWRLGYVEVERTGKADGSHRFVFTVSTLTSLGDQDFTVGFIVTPEALALALSGLEGQTCEVRVSDVEDISEKWPPIDGEATP